MGLFVRLAQAPADVARGKHFGAIGAPLTMNPHKKTGPTGRVRWQNWLQGWHMGRRERLETRQKGGK